MSAVPATIATMNTMVVTMASINIPVGSSPIGPVGPEFASVARSHGVDQATVREYVFLVEGYIKSCYDKPVRMLELGMGCRRVSISSPYTAGYQTNYPPSSRLQKQSSLYAGLSWPKLA